MFPKDELRSNLRSKTMNKTPKSKKPTKLETEISESPFTKFCKSNLSPLKNISLSPKQKPNVQTSSRLNTSKLVEYQTPPAMLKRPDLTDFSPFLNYTAKKVIQKLDFDEKKPNSVIVCFKSPTFNISNSTYTFDEDFVFSADRDKIEEKVNEENEEEDFGGLVSKNPQKILFENENKTNQKESFVKTMSKTKEIIYEKCQTAQKKPYVTPYDKLGIHEKTQERQSFNISQEKNVFKLSERNEEKQCHHHEKTQERKRNPEEYSDRNFGFLSTPKHLLNETISPKIEKKNNISPSKFNSDYQKKLESSFTSKKIICNCKKSRCLKLYCDCFAAGEFCSKECNCCSCANVVENEEERYSSMLALMERNPLAFKPKYDKKDEIEEKVEESVEKIRHAKGCNCKKSNCLKKYCECYQAGIKCTDLCKCDGCKNTEFCNNAFKKRKHNNGNVINIYDSNFESNHNNFTFGFNKSFDEKKEPIKIQGK